MNQYTEIITRYINGELNASEKIAFEEQLKTNATLKQEYELQLKVVGGVKRLGLKNQVSSSFKKVKQQKLIKKIALGVAISIAVFGAVAIIKNVVNKPKNEVLYELNEVGKTTWAEADKKLESQIFKLNPNRDTIIETEKGIVLAIPANSFLNKNGATPTGLIDLEIKEAMTPLDIMKAGLNTMSNSRLLETGGMFYINARDGEENLTIDKSKSLNVNVPVNNNKNDMMLFKGERKADGSINWVDPKPMKKKLTTVDITKLDFYPEHFLDTLKSMGYDIKNKQLTDSIYYSFGCYNDWATSVPLSDSMMVTASAITTVVKDTIKKVAYVPNGEHLFKQNCAVCHSMGAQKLTGPGMAGLLNRIPGGDWLKRYILNNEKLIKSGDPYANKIYNDNGKAAMTVFEGSLNDTEVNALIKYITGKDPMVIGSLYETECPQVSPSSIHAIWDKKFNSTILATKEFEERLKAIFTTCSDGILNLYTKNLNYNLYEIDSVAASLLSGEQKTQFLNFYKRKDGGVEINDDQSKKLQAYFEEKRKTYSEALNKTLKAMYEKEAKDNQVASEKQMKHQTDEWIRNSKTFGEELELNMNEAYRQLGKERPKAPPTEIYLSAPITEFGWNNVDRYVIESTANRSTLDYTDPESGKKAIIKYEPITITVTNFKNYDKVMSYMIPDKLSSFQLMKNNENVFKENLNELMKYGIVTVGFKGNSAYYRVIENAKAQAYNIDLASIKQHELDQKLNSRFGLNPDTDFAKEINYQLFEVKDTQRKKQIQKREEIRDRLYPIVFPCYNKPADASDTLNYDIEK